MENKAIDNVKTLLDAGAALTDTKSFGEHHFAIVPKDYAAIDLELFFDVPARKRAKVITNNSESFIVYLRRHIDKSVSLIYADVDSEESRCNLVAVINDHGAIHPDWRDHICSFAPKQAVEWGRWLEKDKVKMSQSDFAVWLEDNLPDIATVPSMPNGAEILTMALGFEANSDKKLRSKVNLQSGGFAFEYVDKENDQTRTTMQVFERFTIGIPVFDGSGNAYPIDARLKYRADSGSIIFWYELIRPDRVFKTAVADEVKKITDETGLALIYGKPGL